MKNLSRRKKNNIIIASLCAIVVLMGIGYAAFSTQLRINGTSSISSNFNVLITDITSGSIVGGASNASEPTHTDTTATFKNNLTSPGDSITYTITVENRGNIDATLTEIDVNTGNNDAIEFETSGINEGDNLLQNESDELYVTVTYSNSVTSQSENISSTITVTLTYEQAGVGDNGVVLPTETVSLGGQDVETVTYGDGLYADSYEPGRYVYKGANPNNYIEFDNGEIWRIIAKENDGTYKIVKNDLLSNQVWDTNNSTLGRNNGNNTYCQITSGWYPGCNAWALVDGNFVNGNKVGSVTQDASLNTYLNNEYYSDLDVSIKNYIVSHIWGIGGVTYKNSDLLSQIVDENSVTWKGNIALISLSDYLRANSNDKLCGNYMLNQDSISTCQTINWLVPSLGIYWTISPIISSSRAVVYIDTTGNSYHSDAVNSDRAPRPVAYLSSSIQLQGTGSISDPFRIVS